MPSGSDVIAGAAQREPSRSSPTWSIRKPLADWLRAEGARASGKRVLDVGCGVKPYRPFFSGAASYVGVDTQQNPHADLIGAIEALPVEDESFDVVLATQVLEHVDDPQAAVHELYRVTAPGGRVLASTHGVMVFHPNPVDHWRWTHTGLERLFSSGGNWSKIEVTPGAGTAACLGFLVGEFVHLLFKRAHVAGAARPLIAGLNAAGAALDARVALLRDPVPGALFANYHVTAERAL
jgi:SAM-dependent methyltransferase